MGDPAIETTHIVFDSSVYRLNAIKKAALKFAGHCHVHIAAKDAGKIQVSLTPKTSGADLQAIAGELQNEVLDQELREVVAQETEGIRNLLLAQAFSATSLIDPEGDIEDFRCDPKKIGKQVGNRDCK